MSAHATLDAKVETERTEELGLADRDTEKLAKYLSNALADTYVLYLNTQGVHWNVVGPAFYSIHKMTEEQYEDLADAIDDIAERIRALGHPAPATWQEFSEMAVIENGSSQKTTAEQTEDLVTANQKVAHRLRSAVAAAEEVDDVYTADLLTARIGAHEEAAWMLRSILAK